jgi:hypothetical protein
MLASMLLRALEDTAAQSRERERDRDAAIVFLRSDLAGEIAGIFGIPHQELIGRISIQPETIAAQSDRPEERRAIA